MIEMATGDTKSIDYDERSVAFVDVLGFTELVTRSESDSAARVKIGKLLAINILFEKFVRNFINSAEAVFFSDSFAISMLSPEHRLFYLIRETGMLCRYLLLQGFACRGAITTGPLYHRHRFIVGPAFVDAYRLERSVAIYPRVIMDATTMEYWKAEFREDEIGHGPAHSHLESLVKRDRDGQYFLDLFNPDWGPNFIQWSDVIPSSDKVPNDPAEFLKKTSKSIGDNRAASAGNVKVLAKYEWLAAEWAEHAAALQQN
jgi:hypothetical protein